MSKTEEQNAAETFARLLQIIREKPAGKYMLVFETKGNGDYALGFEEIPPNSTQSD